MGIGSGFFGIAILRHSGNSFETIDFDLGMLSQKNSQENERNNAEKLKLFVLEVG